MSGKKPRQNRDEQAVQDINRVRPLWQQYNQWQFDAGKTRDGNVSRINQKYGTGGSKTAALLIAEEGRKYDASIAELKEGATGSQLNEFYMKYGSNSKMTDDEILDLRKQEDVQNAGGSRTINDHNGNPQFTLQGGGKFKSGYGASQETSTEYLTRFFGKADPTDRSARAVAEVKAKGAGSGKDTQQGVPGLLGEDNEIKPYYGW